MLTIALCLVCLILVLLLLREISTAPIGYEDKTGFHSVSQPKRSLGELRDLGGAHHGFRGTEQLTDAEPNLGF